MKYKLNNRGQGLVEYLIIVAIMAVGTMAIMRTMNQTVTQQFARATLSIAGKKPDHIRIDAPNKEDYDKKDMSDFFHGATGSDK